MSTEVPEDDLSMAVPESVEDVENIEEASFDALLKSVQEQKEKNAPPKARADLTRIPEVVDDFFRNFLVKHQLFTTLEAFEVEWYQKFGPNPDADATLVPDVYLENSHLNDKVVLLAQEIENHRIITKKATGLWENVKKERDFHRMNHNRVVQEKSKIAKDLKRLQQHAQVIEPTVTELRQKYESAQKDKMLLRLEKDKLVARISQLEEQLKEAEQSKEAAAAAAPNKSTQKQTSGQTITKWPADNRPNPYLSQPIKPPSNPGSWSCRSTIKAHAMSATSVALHPRKPVVASCSDDGTWRLMSMPQGELIMSGEGHKDWIGGVAMHPKGTMIATASGDKTVKLWDFGNNSCKATLKAHTDGVWCVEFQETGDLLASGSLDHSTRIWDVETTKCRAVLRGHVDAVNSLIWQPYSNVVCTGSGDKTVSLWDTRANFCAQTFYGHHAAVTGVSMPLKGDTIASCDAEGKVILWDVRMIEQQHAFACGPHPANHIAHDRSGFLLAVCSDDTTIKLLSLTDEKTYVLKGHEDAVQCAIFDPSTNGFLVSSGSDTTVRYWS